MKTKSMTRLGQFNTMRTLFGSAVPRVDTPRHRNEWNVEVKLTVDIDSP